MTALSLRNVSKLYPNGFHAVKNLSLDIASGEFVVLLGPSGCGKSTMLRMIAGLEDVSSGAVFFDDTDMTHADPRSRDVGMVFQNYALYPHLSVFENLAFPLRLRNESASAVQSRVQEVAALMRLGELLARKPKELSGGQRQRVALGRAIIRTPRLFLFDEPLSNLDAQLRSQMRVEIARLQEMVNVTSVYVTHDQTEAMTMGDRIVLMNGGVVQQIGTPSDLYDNPQNRFTAEFLGSPAMNFLYGDIVFEQSSNTVMFRETTNGAASNSTSILTTAIEDTSTSASEAGSGIGTSMGGGIGSGIGSGEAISVRLDRQHFTKNPPQTALRATLGIRPEHLSLQPFGDTPSSPSSSSASAPSFRGIVRRSEYLGAETLVHVETVRGAALKVVRVGVGGTGAVPSSSNAGSQSNPNLASRMASTLDSYQASQYNDGHPVTVYLHSRSVLLFGEDGARL
jgi:ABC-type sugar transport system ATPase subunit